MNARHDSHDFFQRFVPQGECVSVLFLQFRRQIYLHIIPFVFNMTSILLLTFIYY